MNKFFTLLSLTLFVNAFSQTTIPPISNGIGTIPDWSQTLTKTAVDSCGAYYNNYPGLVKTSLIFFEGMRTGGAGDFNPYTGRGQRYHAPQPIEISGLQFYAFETNPDLDSLMAITLLLDWDEELDSIGVELARDTVWVTHSAFSPLLVDIEVNSSFDVPVTVEEDYIVAVYTSTNDSLKIITNDDSGDGASEGLSFAYYDNPTAPSYTGWYHTLSYFGPSYDIDYLISPLVKYDLHDDYTLLNNTICPNIDSLACVEYIQKPIFSDPHYNRFHDSPEGKINWNWGDGMENNEVTTACHTYSVSGTLSLTLKDSIRRYNFSDNTCAVEISKELLVLDSTIISDMSSFSMGLSASFEGIVSGADSVLWTFGDDTTSTELNPEHVYTDFGDYDVWLYAYGQCNTDSTMLSITIDDASINENELNVSIYPNPANQEITISALATNANIKIISPTGAIVYSSFINDNQTTINTGKLANGIYMLTIYSEDQQKTIKLVIKH